MRSIMGRRREATTAPVKISQHKLVQKGFEFGPLLIGKTKDLTDASKNPEHVEKLRLTNVSSMDMEVEFLMQKDMNFSTFFLYPTFVHIRKGEVRDFEEISSYV